MKIFKELFKELSGYKNISQALDKNISPVSVTGLSHIHRSQLIYALSGEKTNLVITGSEAEAKKLWTESRQGRKSARAGASLDSLTKAARG